MSRLFINLSNHPSGQWDDPQRNAAMRYGQIVDLPFPEVPPEMGEDDVKTVAMNFYGKIRRLAHKYCNGDSSQVTVMLQGEFTLVYILTKMLREDGIRVVSGSAEAAYRFDTVEAVYRWRGAYVLYVDKVHIIPLPLADFVEGSPDDFPAYISEKTGLSVQAPADKKNKER